MIRYQHWVAAGSEDATRAHVCAHLSAVASRTDNPGEYVDEVQLTTSQESEVGCLVIGYLDADPHADYLTYGYDPYDGVPEELRAEADR